MKPFKEDDILIELLQEKNKSKKYKRIIWLGVLNDNPSLETKTYTNKTVRSEIASEGLQPCLIIWDTPNGEQKYAEITKTNTRANKTYI